MNNPTLNESEAERICDARVQRAMDTDSAYRNAEDADAQKAAEEAIEKRVMRDVKLTYNIPAWEEA